MNYCRIDEIIVFHQLNHQHIKEIAGKLLSQLTSRLEGNNISASFTDEAIDKIADEGFDPVYGARPLKRAIQSKIEDKIAEEMLEGKIKTGDTISITVKDNEFVCETENDDD